MYTEEMARQSTPLQHGLYRDLLFWLAAVAGPLLCYALYLMLGVEDRAGDEPEWRTFLWLSLLFPIAEEWLFRGVVQPRLLRWRFGRPTWLGISGANWVTTLLFVAVHLLKYPSGWTLTVAIPSIVFGWFRDRYRSIIPSCVLHVIYNLVFIWLLDMH